MKRAIDVCGALVGLIVLSPVLAATAIVVRLKLGTPVLFRQQRVGKDERVFEIIKFRTMTDERGPGGELLPDSARLTVFGRWLRSTSLDELPELLNVLRGDMSLVGPRPLLVHYLPRYRGEERRRHEVRPGLTGLAQVRGRNDLGWDERLALDVAYVDTRSTWLDLRLLLETVVGVVRRSGVSAAGHATMPELGEDRA